MVTTKEMEMSMKIESLIKTVDILELRIEHLEESKALLVEHFKNL